MTITPIAKVISSTSKPTNGPRKAPNEEKSLSLPLPFFFQAEDGIRDGTVTGVQTCALPIFRALPVVQPARADRALVRMRPHLLAGRGIEGDDAVAGALHVHRAVDHDRVERDRADRKSVV